MKKTMKFDINPLFGGPSLQERNKSGSPYREVAISDVDVDPNQPRRVFSEEALVELAASIKEYGLLCPILVKPLDGGTFRLISGERRLRASKLAGLEAIPVILDNSNDETATVLSKQLVENLQRQDLSSMERALAIGQLRDQFSLSIREIASKLGVSKGFVQRSIEVLALPDDLQAALIAGAAESKILIIAKVADRKKRAELLKKIDSLTREDLDFEVRRATKDSDDSPYHSGTRKTQKAENQEDKRIREEIQTSLGTKVRIYRNKKSKQKGKVIVDFYSEEDFAEVYKRLAGK